MTRHENVPRVTPQVLLQQNEFLANRLLRECPRHNETIEGAQAPGVLWIGCSDSRILEVEMTGAVRGDLFVTRNVANQFRTDDANALAVLTFAVEELHVEHIVVVGHTACGGVKASHDQARGGPLCAHARDAQCVEPLENWLRPVLALARKIVESSVPPDQEIQVITEENVRMQVRNILQTRAVQNAVRRIQVHGWVYDMRHGKLNDLRVGDSSSSSDVIDASDIIIDWR